MPTRWSSFSAFSLEGTSDARANATPPAGTIPSCVGAFRSQSRSTQHAAPKCGHHVASVGLLPFRYRFVRADYYAPGFASRRAFAQAIASALSGVLLSPTVAQPAFITSSLRE